VSQQDDAPSPAELGRVNADLARALKRCSGMVRDYRARLMAANSNDAAFMLCAAADKDRDREDEGKPTG
jgi:hypothetical protein